MGKPRKILITGLGSIGRRYARLLLAEGYEVMALRSGHGEPFPGVKDLYSWAEVKKAAPGFAFITNPTALHISTALKCAALGMHLFIEKPLDMNLRGLGRLLAMAKKRKLSSYVAYNLRFHPGVQELRRIVSSEGFTHASVRCSSWLPDWRPGTDHRKSYSANASLGGGVVLDLSHDPDYTTYIFGEAASIEGIARRSSGVTVDSEDVADMVVKLKKGGHVPVHVDFCGRFPERTVKCSTRLGSYVLDLMNGSLLASRGGRTTEKKFKTDRDFTYKAEIRYFFSHIGKPMMNDLKESSGLLVKLLKFKRANKLS